jgi:threonine/homoserine/homoserine lactone efflux protein
MISLEFLITSLIVVLIPGTGVIFSVSTGLIQGRSARQSAVLQ